MATTGWGEQFQIFLLPSVHLIAGDICSYILFIPWCNHNGRSSCMWPVQCTKDASMEIVSWQEYPTLWSRWEVENTECMLYFVFTGGACFEPIERLVLESEWRTLHQQIRTQFSILLIMVDYAADTCNTCSILLPSQLLRSLWIG